MDALKINSVEEKIITLRGIPVILDSDVAELYGVETREINQAIRNNPDKFPEGYIVQLNKQEWGNLKSKILTSSWGGKNKLPNVFTEKGLYMLATILKGQRAIQTTIAIVETFTKLRELSCALFNITQTTNEADHNLLLTKSGNLLNELLFNDLMKVATDTSVEFNLGLMKIKHNTRRERKSQEEQHEIKELLASILKKLEKD
jgi:phage regulator Rha-like protein